MAMTLDYPGMTVNLHMIKLKSKRYNINSMTFQSIKNTFCYSMELINLKNMVKEKKYI